MSETIYRCPHCRAEFPAADGLAIHLHSHPDCGAHASLARSLATVGVRLCTRCHMGIVGAAYARWTTDGFVHTDCLTQSERADWVQAQASAASTPR